MLVFQIAKQLVLLGLRKGKQVFFAKQVHQETTTLRDIEKMVEKMTSLSGPDVRACLAAFSEVFQMELAKGHIIDLGDLGTFKPLAQVTRMDKREEVKPETVRGFRVQYFPRQAIRQALKSIQVTIEDTDFVAPRKNKPGAKPKAKKNNNAGNSGSGGSQTPGL